MPKTKHDYVSARGVYYDLEKSPYIYTDELGNIFKFSSRAKLKSFEARLNLKKVEFMKEAKRLEQLGYELTKAYATNEKCLPKIVYNGMIYK